VARFKAFCKDRPDDGICRPQKELPTLTMDQAVAFLESPEAKPAVDRAADDLSLPEVRAAFAMAPAIVQALDPRSLQALRAPVAIVLGDGDEVAPPNTNGSYAARMIPGARLKVLPRVGHYDFLSRCTPGGEAVVKDLCPVRVPRSETHRAALEQALMLFGRAFGPPP
jgi:predicted dienelactone hydrolase